MAIPQYKSCINFLIEFVLWNQHSVSAGTKCLGVIDDPLCEM